MKIAICCLNSKYIHASLAPWCLFSALKDKSAVKAEVIEDTINNDIKIITDKIINGKYDVVSFSCYIWNITKTLEICKEIKEITNSTIILGGPEVSYRAKNVLGDYPFIDFVLSGEGEESFPQFVETHNTTKDYSTVDGLSYRDSDNAIISNPEKVYIGTPVNPYCDEFFDSLNNRISYIETSRGCPYNCAFCLSGRCSKLRFFDIEQTKEKIIKLSNSGTKTIKFVDRTFNASPKRANEILSFILENHKKTIPENVCFHFEIAGDILTEDTFNLLKAAPKGLFQLEIGMQTFNEKTLEAIHRKTNCKKLIENIQRLIRFQNMHIHIDLIAGLPYEDIESFENSFNIGYSLGANMLQMGFLKLLYGADMREMPDKFPCKFNENPPYEVMSTPWLSEEEMAKLHNCEDALERMYNSGRFLCTLDYLLKSYVDSPFKFFYEFGNAIKVNKISLSDYSIQIYNYFKSKVDEELLREALICDLLSCSSALQIPEVLKRNDPLYKQIKKHFVDGTSEKIKIAILYKSSKVFAVNQSRPKDFNGRYQGRFYELDDFKKIIID